MAKILYLIYIKKTSSVESKDLVILDKILIMKSPQSTRIKKGDTINDH
ncbi:hypothetical protein [Flavobacterium antarcticum]|nr:hypothetical protein [Flavobacterium antarcticum]